jgi:hypothetical protein
MGKAENSRDRAKGTRAPEPTFDSRTNTDNASDPGTELRKAMRNEIKGLPRPAAGRYVFVREKLETEGGAKWSEEGLCLAWKRADGK